MSPSADKLIYLSWNPHRHTNTHTRAQSLPLSYSCSCTHSLNLPNLLSPPHSLFLSLSLSSASPSASQVLILLSFHTIFQHRFLLLSLSSRTLFTSAVKLSAATEIVIIQCLLGSFPTNFNVWKLSLNFEWQWGRVSEREGVERGGNWSELRLPISSLWLATCRLPTRTVLSACPPFHSTLALFSFPAVPLSPPLLFLCALCKLSPIHINHVASATQNTATY